MSALTVREADALSDEELALADRHIDSGDVDAELRSRVAQLEGPDVHEPGRAAAYWQTLAAWTSWDDWLPPAPPRVAAAEDDGRWWG